MEVLGFNILVSFQATQLRKTDASFLVKVKGEKLTEASREKWDLSYEYLALLKGGG